MVANFGDLGRTPFKDTGDRHTVIVFVKRDPVRQTSGYLPLAAVRKYSQARCLPSYLLNTSATRVGSWLTVAFGQLAKGGGGPMTPLSVGLADRLVPIDPSCRNVSAISDLPPMKH